MEWLAQEFQKRTGVRCEFFVGDEELWLDEERTTALFRICQEALTNVTRYAQATEVRISVESEDGHVSLRVSDNGRGISEAESRATDSFGCSGCANGRVCSAAHSRFRETPAKARRSWSKFPRRNPTWRSRSMLHILITDDHAVLRRGLMQILEDGFGKVRFGEASNASETLAQLGKNRWDMAVLDITMPGRSGLDVLKEIKALRPELPVLILSVHSEDQFAVRVLKAGAAGFLNKDFAPEELVKAVRRVLAGGRYVSTSLAEKLAFSLDKKGGGQFPHQELSDREFQVLRMIASGKTVSEIGEELGLSVKTISTYRTRILDKMGLHTNAEITRYAFEHKLVE
jgi:DNA-binding NarL/FixJ family response regulator